MASESWACLGGIELWNACRSKAYAENGFRPPSWRDFRMPGCCGPEMAAALFDPAYTTPKADGAPWVSTSEPGSSDFGGFVPVSIEGLGPGPISRDLTQRANGRGSFLGPATQESPTIVVTGYLFGKTCCSVDYGLRWLGTVLQGSCDSDCDGDTLSFVDCCPDFGACATAGVSPADCLDPHLRYLEGVQLVSSVQVVERHGSCCGNCNGTTWMQVRFSLAATHPCVYRDPVVIANDQRFPALDQTCNITWVLVPDGQDCPPEEGCVEPVDCIVDPSCPPPPKPPKAPAPINPCICDSFASTRNCITVPAGSIPEYTEGIPVLTVQSGSKDLRQLRVRFWQNDLGLPPEQLDPCATCGEVTLSRIPAGSTFTFDGTKRSAMIECPGSAPTDATPLMGSAGGQLPLAWPEIACAASTFTVCVEADSDTVAADAKVSLSIVPTECY